MRPTLALIVGALVAIGPRAAAAGPLVELKPTATATSPAGLLGLAAGEATVIGEARATALKGLGTVLELASDRSAFVVRSPALGRAKGPLTIEACLYQTARAEGYGAFVVRKSDSNKGDGYALQIDKEGHLVLQINWAQALRSNATVPLGQWTYVAGVFDPTSHKVRLALNDSVTEAAAPIPSIKPSAWRLHIGGTGYPGLSLRGFIAYLAIHDKSLTAEELATHARQWAARTKDIRPPERPLFRFVQITDTHITDEASTYLLEQAIDQINAMRPRPDFVVFTGDLTNDSTPEEFSLFRSIAARLRVPWHVVIGNHDMAAAKKNFEQAFGPRNYSFDVGPVTCLVLDSTKATDVTYGGGFTDETLAWLKQTLAGLPADRPLLVFCHHGFYSDQPYAPKKNLFCDVENPQAVLDLLKGRKVLGVFAGHAHAQAEARWGKTPFVVTATLSLTRGNGDKTPAGFREVKVYSDHVQSRYWVVGERPRSGEAVAVTVAQQEPADFVGRTNEALQQAIDSVHQQGGGTVFLAEGTYEVAGPVVVKERVALVGRGATLALPALPVTTARQPARAGSRVLAVAGTEGFRVGQRVEVQAKNGDTPYFTATIAKVEKESLELARDLPVDVPAGTRVL
ncbi:MAG: metallophosphoesterase, partial [Armatimonadetes bacterium]|nr:metallophosphoesterase [Armatimonadota bacterium]